MVSRNVLCQALVVQSWCHIVWLGYIALAPVRAPNYVDDIPDDISERRQVARSASLTYLNTFSAINFIFAAEVFLILKILPYPGRWWRRWCMHSQRHCVKTQLRGYVSSCVLQTISSHHSCRRRRRCCCCCCCRRKFT